MSAKKGGDFCTHSSSPRLCRWLDENGMLKLNPGKHRPPMEGSTELGNDAAVWKNLLAASKGEPVTSEEIPAEIRVPLCAHLAKDYELFPW